MIDEVKTVINELSCSAADIDPADFSKLSEAIMDADRVFVAGMGRSGLVIKSFAMRLMHMRKTTYVVGDVTTPSITARDLLLIASGSGNTASLVSLAKKAKAAKAALALITIYPSSSIGEMADCILSIDAPAKADGHAANVSAQPMATLFEQGMFICLDALVLRLMDMMQIGADEMYLNHANLE